MSDLKKLRDLNVSLLEVLTHTYTYLEDYCKKYNIPMPHNDRFYILLREASHLIGKINEIALPTSNQQPFTSPDLEHWKKYPEDETKP